MIAIYDYLSMTFSGYTASEIKSILGMTDCVFEPRTGARGYASGELFASISIFSGPPSNNRFTTWLEMTGQGCRAFETFGNGNYQELFRLAVNDHENIHITRLDVAFDDAPIDPRENRDVFSPDYLIDLNLISDLVQDVNQDGSNNHYISKSRFWEVDHSSKGTTIYFGSPTSNIRFRIYDKASERGFTNLHWVRFECQLRDENAFSFVVNTYLGYDLGLSFQMLINNYLRFIEQDDINKSRCSTSPWWQSIIDTVQKITLFSKPGMDYNLSRMVAYYTGKLGNGIYTLLECLGEEEFIKQVKQNRSPYFPPKYSYIISEAKAGKSK